MPQHVLLSENPINQGYAWSQTLNFDVGILAPGDVIRADFRTEPATTPVYSATVTRTGDSVLVSLSAAQTKTMPFGALRSDIVAGNTALGLQLVVPVSILTTEAP